MSDSDSDDGFDFKKLRSKKKETLKTKKLQSFNSPSKPFKIKEDTNEGAIRIVNEITKNDEDKSLEDLMKEAQRAARRKLYLSDSDDDDEIAIIDDEEEPRKSKRKKKKINYTQDDPIPYEIGLSSRIERESEDMRRRILDRERRDREDLDEDIVELIPEIPSVNISLRIFENDSFIRIFKVNRTEQFAEKVFLQYALEAGFEDPESFDIIWDQNETVKLIKFYDTPDSLKMPDNQPSHLFIKPKKGTIRQERNQGDIKIKFNIKNNPNPVEMIFQKGQTFGDILKVFAKNNGYTSSKIHFNFDGERVPSEETPETLDMEELDIIDVIEVQKCM